MGGEREEEKRGEKKREKERKMMKIKKISSSSLFPLTRRG
jgi:hypothetical protein